LLHYGSGPTSPQPINDSFVEPAGFLTNLIHDLKQTGAPELLAVFSGILSVWFSKKENRLVYPVGLLNTLLYIYLSAKGGLFGEATVNLYYTVMGVYGWWCWSKRKPDQSFALRISRSSRRELNFQFAFFTLIFLGMYLLLSFMKNQFAKDTLPLADSLASALAFTGMYLMTRKKMESWYWWILTNALSIPLYAVKHYPLTSIYYLVLLLLAIAGLREWRNRINRSTTG
jgi:nicotinamide mononucleotide transporter